MNEQLQAKLKEIFPTIIFNAELTGFHNFLKPAGKAGAIAKLYEASKTKLEALTELANLQKEYDFPIKVLGAHSNILITSAGFEGLILLDTFSGSIEQALEVSDNGKVIVSQPILLSWAVKHLADKGYDLTHLAGIPGTVFAAVLNNSGANRTQKSISSDDCISKVQVFDLQEAKLKELEISEDFFSVRNSKLKDINKPVSRYVIMSVEFNLLQRDAQELKAILKDYSVNRSKVSVEGYQYHTAGSFWSNGHALKATGKRVKELTQELGIFDKEINGVGYSPEFGFLYTSAESTDKDVADFTKLSYDSVLAKYNYKLHAEVEILDRQGLIDIEAYWQKYGA
jgi:UDP-N-acetylenolpyruvoylglucosamine reductase